MKKWRVYIQETRTRGNICVTAPDRLDAEAVKGVVKSHLRNGRITLDGCSNHSYNIQVWED